MKRHATPSKAGRTPLPKEASNDVVMIVDSDEEQPAQKNGTNTQQAEFEAEEEELDPLAPYPGIVQRLDVPLSAEAIHIAFPNLPSRFRPNSGVPSFFAEQLVVAVACSDSTARVIALPLSPPSDDVKTNATNPGHGSYVDQVILPAGAKGHRSPPNKVALTWTSPAPSRSPDDEDEDEDEAIPHALQDEHQQDWELILASVSAETSGVLLISRIPLISDAKTWKLQAGNIAPAQRRYLQSPVADVAFIPAHYPSKRHTQLLLAEKGGIVRVYHPFHSPESKSQSYENASVARSTRQGVWLATFSTPFHSSSPALSDLASPSLSTRKNILAAQWASNGGAVIMLLADGEYGLWDVEKSPVEANSFALRGFIGSSGSSSSRPASASEDKGRSGRSSLAPMTPRTRRDREERLFSAPSSTKSAHASRGGMSVLSRPTPREGDAAEESVVLWYSDAAYSIPNLQAFRDRSSITSSSSGSLYSPGLTQIEGLDAYGEMLTSIDQFALNDSTRGMSHSQPGLLIAAEHRLLIMSKEVPGLDFGASSMAVARTEDEDEEMANGVEERTDLELLSRGELDIAGMDRMLDSMSGSRFGASKGARRVGFAASAIYV